MNAEQIAAETAARIAEADAEAHKANVAFAAGKFPEYFEAQQKTTEQAIQDEYDQLFGSDADSGDREEDG